MDRRIVYANLIRIVCSSVPNSFKTFTNNFFFEPNSRILTETVFVVEFKGVISIEGTISIEE